jgi:DNA-directed RNA polymerase specialized sigma24 family protein
MEQVFGVFFANAKGQGYSVEEIAELANVPVVYVNYLISRTQELNEPVKESSPKKSPVYG